MGVSMGKSSAGLGFTLVLNVLLRLLAERFPHITQAWIFDDGFLLMKKAELKEALAMIEVEGPPLGLHISPSKTKLWTPKLNADFSGFEKYKCVGAGVGLNVLGSPLGKTHAQIISILQPIVTKIKEDMEKVRKLPSTHDRLLLYRNCVLFPAMCFLLRTVKASDMTAQLQVLDDVVKTALQDILVGATLNPDDMVLLHLPCSLGGSGISLPSFVAQAAHVGSIYQSIVLQQQILHAHVGSLTPLEQHYAPRLAEVKECVDPVNISPTATVVSAESLRTEKRPQKWLTRLLNTALQQKTFHRGNGTTAAKLNHIEACKEARGDWLSAIPHAKSAQLTNPEMRVCLLYRLGRDVYTKSVQCPRCKSAILDRTGRHALICKAGPVTATTRHNLIRNAIFEICQEVGAPASKEKTLGRLVGPRNDHNDGVVDADSEERPADVLIDNWLFGEAALVDVSVCDAHKHQSVIPEDFKAVATFNLAANKKIDNYKNRVRALGHHFLPFVVGSLGGFCPDAVRVLSFLAAKWELKFNVPASHAVGLLRRRIALVLQKSQASQLIDRGHLAEIMA